MDVEIIFWLAVSGLLGWAGSSFSKKRGRGKLVGFLFGFFLGLLGLGIIWFISRDMSAARERLHLAAVAEQRATLEVTAIVPLVTAAAAAEPDRLCSDCGTQLLQSDSSCYWCNAATG